MKPMIRDKFDAPLIRTENLLQVLNGSKLVVSPGTCAYIRDAGEFTGPFMPGIHELRTDVGFFRRGERGSEMTVYRIGTQELYYCKWGTGKVLFKSPALPITRNLRAPYTLCMKVANQNLFIEHVRNFTLNAIHETLDQFLIFFATDTIQAQIQMAVNLKDPSEVSLQEVSAISCRELRPFFKSYGIDLVSLKIHELNVEENKAAENLEAELATLNLLFGGDRNLYLQHSLLTKSNHGLSDALSLAGTLPQNETDPDTWGGI
jgi:membrane protease subunit (stomatin/prohibitin family)